MFMERPTRRRRRPALSCLECRRRKIKCDRSDPCRHCASAKTKCTFDIHGNSSDPVIQRQSQRTHGASRGSPPGPSAYASPLSQPQQINAGRTVTEHGSDISESRVPVVGQSNTPIALDRNNISPPNRGQGEPSDLQSLLRRVQHLEEHNAIHRLSEPGRGILTRQPGLQDSQVTLNKTRTPRYSHWLGVDAASENYFGPIYACYSQATGSGNATSFQDAETAPLVSQMGDFLQKCKDISRCSKVGRPSRLLSGPEFGLASLSREVADAMVNLYFRSFESTYRILHIPSFWIEYRNYWDHPQSVTTKLRLKILLVIAIGSSLSDHGDTNPGFRNMVHQWIYAAQTWLSGPLEKDRLDITGLQTHCLTLLARQIFSVGGDLTWISMGSLVHSAMQIGLHRDPKHLPAMSILQAELRRRLWATILEMAVQASLDTGMPPRISFDEFDTKPPSNTNDDEMDESTTVLQPHPRGTFTTTSIQLILLDSLQTRVQILKLLSCLNSEISYQDILTLSSEITDAYRAYSSFMKENEGSGVTAFHRNLLDYLVRRIMIPLHCPFSGKSRTNPLFYYSLKISVDVALAIISPEPDEGFSHLMARGVLLREGIRYSSVIISRELLAEAETQRVDGTLQRNSLYRKLLKQAVRDMILLAEERIRRGETNVKNHMFLEMVLVQVEAVEEGIPCEAKIAQSGRDSLEFCYNLLETWFDNIVSPSPNDTGFTSTSFGSGQEGNGLYLDLDYFLPDVMFS